MNSAAFDPPRVQRPLRIPGNDLPAKQGGEAGRRLLLGSGRKKGKLTEEQPQAYGGNRPIFRPSGPPWRELRSLPLEQVEDLTPQGLGQPGGPKAVRSFLIDLKREVRQHLGKSGVVNRLFQPPLDAVR